MVAVQGHHVALGDDPRRQLRASLHLLADEKKVARAPAAASTSRIAGVPSGCGPSSNVTATPAVVGSVRGRERARAASGSIGAST